MYDMIIDSEGNLTTIYSDDIADLLDEGDAVINRASTVEPNSEGLWQANMQKVGGPLLSAHKLRSAALAEEVLWLQEHLPSLVQDF